MGDAEVLAAFREVTGWSDEQVLHLAGCGRCVPICGHEEENCPDSPAGIALTKYISERSDRLRAARQTASGDMAEQARILEDSRTREADGTPRRSRKRSAPRARR